MANLVRKVVDHYKRESDRRLYRRLFERGYLPKATNLFDYNWIIQKRPTPYKERHIANETYGIGYQFHRFTGNYEQLFFLVEHSINSVRTDNPTEYLENEFPLVFTPSRGRWDIIQPLTHKLVIPYGPNTLPYAQEICDDYMIAAIKQNLGKTLVVYPQHNNAEFSYFETKNLIRQFIDYVEAFNEKHHFDTILCCSYFRDIMGSAQVEYEKRGWKIISCGNNNSYDFGDISKTVYRIADCVVVQGSYATVLQATYMGVPAVSIPGNREINRGNGVIEDINVTMGDGVIYKQCDELFSEYTGTISKEQMEWCTKWGGYDCIKTAEELRLFMDFAKKVRKSDMSDAYLKKMVSKPKYEPIRKYIMESLEKRA